MEILTNAGIIIVVKIIVDLIGKKIQKRWLPVIAGVIATIIVFVYSLVFQKMEISELLTMIFNSTTYTTFVHDFIKKTVKGE